VLVVPLSSVLASSPAKQLPHQGFARPVAIAVDGQAETLTSKRASPTTWTGAVGADAETMLTDRLVVEKDAERPLAGGDGDSAARSSVGRAQSATVMSEIHALASERAPQRPPQERSPRSHRRAASAA